MTSMKSCTDDCSDRYGWPVRRVRPGTSRHEPAAEILDRTYDGEFGVSYLSDFIFDEAVTLTYRRVRSNEAATRLGKCLRGVDPYPSAFELLHVSRGIFADAVNVFEQYDDQQLSFTGGRGECSGA
ncbi:MAG: hypothetical protein ACLFNI_09875 [Natronomonas sp.]